jgi:hypothetical protein
MFFYLLQHQYDYWRHYERPYFGGEAISCFGGKIALQRLLAMTK